MRRKEAVEAIHCEPELPIHRVGANIGPNSSAWVRENFVVGKLVGAGSFGRVYKVEARKGPGKELAMKELTRGAKPRAVALEIRVLSRLGGKFNIPQMYAAHRSFDRVFIVMDYIKHKPIRALLSQMTLAESLEYIRNLLIALQYLHSKGIVHRDVKPGNFLYDRRAKRYALIDYGLAVEKDDIYSHSGPRLPSSGTARVLCGCVQRGTVCNVCRSAPKDKHFAGGTAGFRAPEILLHLPQCGPPVDVWAAGMTFLSLVIRRFPVLRPKSDTEGLQQFGILKLMNLAKERGVTLMMSPSRPGLSLRRLIFSFIGKNRHRVMGNSCSECKKLISDNVVGVCLCKKPNIEDPDEKGDAELQKAVRVLRKCLTINDRKRPSAKALLEVFDAL